MTKDRFDNCYIDVHIRNIDKKRKELDRETILPLNGKEAKKYVHSRNKPPHPLLRTQQIVEFFWHLGP